MIRTLALLVGIGAALFIHHAHSAEIVRYEFQNNAQDLSGNANHGTINGSPSFGPGLTGNAITFNNPVGGSAGPDYVLLPNSPSILGLSNSSFSYALRLLSNDNAQTNGRLFGGRNGSGSGLALIYNSAATPETYGGLFGSTGSVGFGHGAALVDPNGVVTDGNWHWTVVTVDRTADNVKLYVDEDLIDTQPLGTLGTLSFADLGIGRFNGAIAGDTAYAARGTTVQDFILFDTALTAQEVLDLVSEVSSSTAAPEPGVGLLLTGLAGVLLRRRRTCQPNA